MDRPPAEPLIVTLPFGRRVAYETFGDAAGLPVLALHGTPGSRLKFRIADTAARDAGLKLVSVDRWGYGHSDPHPAPTLAAFARDACAVADALELGRFGVLGVSGGGPFAAATAAALGARVTALALVAPVGPIAGEAGLSMSAFHHMAFRGLARAPRAVRIVFRGFRAMLSRNDRLALRIASARSAAVDRRVVCQPYERQSLADAFRVGLAPGTDGPAVDMQMFGRPWDIDPGRIVSPTMLWIGDADRHVPVAAARRLAARIPGCSLVDLPSAGHYWVMSHTADVLGWMSRTMRAASPQCSGS